MRLMAALSRREFGGVIAGVPGGNCGRSFSVVVSSSAGSFHSTS